MATDGGTPVSGRMRLGVAGLILMVLVGDMIALGDDSPDLPRRPPAGAPQPPPSTTSTSTSTSTSTTLVALGPVASHPPRPPAS